MKPLLLLQLGIFQNQGNIHPVSTWSILSSTILRRKNWDRRRPQLTRNKAHQHGLQEHQVESPKQRLPCGNALIIFDNLQGVWKKWGNIRKCSAHKYKAKFAQRSTSSSPYIKVELLSMESSPEIRAIHRQRFSSWILCNINVKPWALLPFQVHSSEWFGVVCNA
jgi:hypothetical protein